MPTRPRRIAELYQANNWEAVVGFMYQGPIGAEATVIASSRLGAYRLEARWLSGGRSWAFCGGLLHVYGVPASLLDTVGAVRATAETYGQDPAPFDYTFSPGRDGRYEEWLAALGFEAQP